jgi:hypothetical protein
VTVRARVQAGVALLVAAGLLAAAGASSAQATGEVTAFSLGARSYAVRVLFDTPGSLPIGPLVELTAPEARATLSTGDEGSAFSAVGYPGPVLAGLPQIAATAGADLSFLPPYPFAVTATSSGPTEVHDSEAVPGSSMDAVVDGGHVEAVTRTPALGLPGVVELGTLRASATADHDTTVRAEGSTEAGGLSLLGGLLTIGAVRSNAQATSDGGEPMVTASTDVLDVTFLGVPAIIGVDGVELLPGSTVLQGVVASVLEPLGGPNGVLASTGLRIRAGATIDERTVDRARAGAEGLTIEVNGALDIAVLDLVLAALPPIPAIPGVPVGPTDAIGLLQANQVRSLNIGQVVVDLTARGAADADSPPTGSGAPAGAALPSFGSPSFPTGTAGGGAPAGGGSEPTAPAGLPLPPLPASGALAAVGGALLASVGLRRFADFAVTPAAAVGACTLIDPEAPDGS